MLQHSVCISLIALKETLRTRTIKLWNEWYHLFQDEAVSKNLAAAEMKAGLLKMRKDVWIRTLFSVSQWGVYTGRQVMYYLESDLPLCLIRAWLREVVTVFFPPCKNMNVCSGMKVNLWPPHRTWSIPAYIECKVQEMHYTPPVSWT